MRRLQITPYQIILYLLLAVVSAACSKSVTMVVSTAIPSPLVEKLPLKMGIYYDDAFRDYVYQEDSGARPDWAIDSGESQVQLFEQIFSSMFSQTSEVKDKTADNTVDGILHPEIVEMQFALPDETRTKFYEYWVKYKLTLYDNSGDFIATWPVTGYGKSSTEFLKSRDKGLNAAINQAMRDVGAKLAISFPKVTGVNDWLESKQ